MEVTINIQQKIHSQRPRASHPNPSQSPFHRERRPTVQREDEKRIFFFFFKVFQRLETSTCSDSLSITNSGFVCNPSSVKLKICTAEKLIREHWHWSQECQVIYVSIHSLYITCIICRFVNMFKPMNLLLCTPIFWLFLYEWGSVLD